MDRFSFNSGRLVLVFAGAMLFIATPFAFGSTASPTPSDSSASEATDQQHSSTADTASQTASYAQPETVQAFQHQALVSLTQAIRTAEKHSNGKALGAKFEMRHGKPLYLVRTYEDNEVWVEAVDAKTGKVLGKGTMIARDKLDHVDTRQIQALQNERTSLGVAIADAQQQRGGKAIEASLAPSKNERTAAFDIHLVNNGKVRTAMINPQSGKLE